MDKRAFFRCGSALVTRIHDLAIATERANQHGILTDCPQRDERQGWMNDATVRFQETPYNFDFTRMFEKLVGDLIGAQSAGRRDYLHRAVSSSAAGRRIRSARAF